MMYHDKVKSTSVKCILHVYNEQVKERQRPVGVDSQRCCDASYQKVLYKSKSTLVQNFIYETCISRRKL